MFWEAWKLLKLSPSRRYCLQETDFENWTPLWYQGCEDWWWYRELCLLNDQICIIQQEEQSGVTCVGCQVFHFHLKILINAIHCLSVTGKLHSFHFGHYSVGSTEPSWQIFFDSLNLNHVFFNPSNQQAKDMLDIINTRAWKWSRRNCNQTLQKRFLQHYHQKHQFCSNGTLAFSRHHSVTVALYNIQADLSLLDDYLENTGKMQNCLPRKLHIAEFALHVLREE